MTGVSPRRYPVLNMSAAETILATKSSFKSTGVSYKFHVSPDNNVQWVLRSLFGQIPAPPIPFHRVQYVAFKKCQILLERRTGVPSYINHLYFSMGSGTDCNKQGSTCSKKIRYVTFVNGLARCKILPSNH